MFLLILITGNSLNRSSSVRSCGSILIIFKIENERSAPTKPPILEVPGASKLSRRSKILRGASIMVRGLFLMPLDYT